MAPRSGLVLFLMIAISALPLVASNLDHIPLESLTVEQAVDEMTTNLEKVHQLLRQLEQQNKPRDHVTSFYNEWNIKMHQFNQRAAMFGPDDKLPDDGLTLMKDFRLKFAHFSRQFLGNIKLDYSSFSYQIALAMYRTQLYYAMISAAEKAGHNVTRARAAMDEIVHVAVYGRERTTDRLVAAMAEAKRAVVALPRVEDVNASTQKLATRLSRVVTETTQALVSDDNLREGFNEDQASSTVVLEETRLWLVILAILVLLAIIGVGSLWFFIKKGKSILVDKKTTSGASQTTFTSTSSS